MRAAIDFERPLYLLPVSPAPCLFSITQLRRTRLQGDDACNIFNGAQIGVTILERGVTTQMKMAFAGANGFRESVVKESARLLARRG